MGVGLEVQGRPPHLELFPWASTSSGGLDTRLFQELGLEQERKLAESFSPKELTHLGRKDNSMRQRHTPSRASGCEVTEWVGSHGCRFSKGCPNATLNT